MARRQVEEEKPVRKSLLVVGGVALAAALIGFVIMNFVIGGGSDTPPPSTSTVPGVAAPIATPTPVPVKNEITSGGRDPFAPQGLAAITTPAPVASAASSAASAPQPSALASATVTSHFTLKVVSVSGSAADLQFNGQTIKGVHAGDKLPDGVSVQKIEGSCASFDQGGSTFSVCQGQTVKR